MSETIRIEIVRDVARTKQIAQQWDALHAQVSASIFQSRAWFEAWWETRTPGIAREPRIALAWRGETLVGLMALAVTRHRGLRVLEWAAKEHTDYCDILVAPGLDRGDLASRLWVGLRANGGFDLAYLSHLLPDSGGLALSRQSGSGFSPGRRGTSSLRVRSTWASGEAWLASQTKKARQNHRRSQKQLSEFGTVRFRQVGPDEDLNPVIDRIAALKRDWLVRTGNRSTILDRDAAPLRALVDVMARAGKLCIHVIECDDLIVSAAINLREADKLMAFLIAYDPIHERASVGNYLLVETIMRAIDEGASEVDFLCGDEGFKSRFANAEVQLVSAVHGRTLRGKLAIAFDDLRSSWRRWRQGREAVPNGQPADAAA